MKIKPQKLKLIIILVIIAGLIFFSYLQISKNLDLKNRVKERETNLEMLSLKIKKLSSLKPQSKKIESDIEELSSRFLKKEDPLPFVLALEKIAEVQGVEQSISLKEEGEKVRPESDSDTKVGEEEKKDTPAQFDHLTFSISVSGSKDNLVFYLQEVEKSKFLLDIASINLLFREENTVSASLILRVFTL